MRRIVRLAAWLGLLLSVAAQAQPASKHIETQLTQKLVGRVAIVRDFYTNSELHYDATGHVLGNPHRGFGPIDGSFYIARVSLKGPSLEIHGNGAIPVWDDVNETVTWHSLPPKRTVKVDASRVSDLAAAEQLTRSILQSPNEAVSGSCTADEKDRFKKAVRKDLTAAYTVSAKAANKTNDAIATSLDAVPRMCFPTGEVAYTVSSGVVKPTPKHTPDPDYSPIGISSHVTGKVDLMFIVNEAGEAISVIMVGKPLGAGLDEQTLSTMRGWRFEPATFQGKPVPVALFVEFHFQLR